MARSPSGNGEPNAAQTLEPQDLRDLVSFQLRQLSNLYTKNTASVYQRKFGLTMNEWRLIALIDTAENISLNRLASQAQFDKGLTSPYRGQTDRARIDLAADRSNDARGIALSLTEQGQALVAGCFRKPWS